MADPPNIVLMLSDDHGAWAAGCYGNRELPTPHLDRLAAQGTRFAQALTPCPVCAPARACFMTGRTPSQVGIHDWIEEPDPTIHQRHWLTDELTLPQLLKGEGYHTVRVGKWHLGHSDQTPPGFDHGFAGKAHTGPHFGRIPYLRDGKALTIEGAKTRVYTDAAIDYMDQAPDDKPLFLYLGHSATHSPYQAEAHDPAAVEALGDDLSFDDIPAYHPHPWHKNEGVAGGVSLSDQEARSRYLGYYAGVTGIDRSLGRVLEALERTGRAENTIVIYTGDHGCALGHQGYWGKGNSTRPLNMYETSLRVPLVMRGPGIAAGQVIEQAVDHYDSFQTVCELAGIDTGRADLADRAYPGRSYGPMARGENSGDWDNTHYGEYGDLRMIRTPDRKFVKRYPHGPYDLFDLEHDPGETINCAGWEQYAEDQDRLETQLEAWYAHHQRPQTTGLRVKQLPMHNHAEAWRDGRRERRGLQVYPDNAAALPDDSEA